MAENAQIDQQREKAAAYERHRAGAAARQASLAEAGQEIGPPNWGTINWDRRNSCERNFRLFCETYHPRIFRLAWSPDHLRAIARIERAVLNGELFAFAMPRGSGKTVLCEAAVRWALLYGHHRFVVLVAASDGKARKLLRTGVFNPFERDQLLLADFPEVCWPIKSLKRSPQRAAKQVIDGRHSDMLWTKEEIILPTVQVPDDFPASARREDGLSVSSGAIVMVSGLTGSAVRGPHKDMPDGSIMRPSLVLLDDPQTKASAKSPTQTQDRVELLMGDVLGMAGPDADISGMMPCTVIRPDDMADQILDADKHPEWHGERCKLIYEFPTNEGLWDQFAALLAADQRRGAPDLGDSTEFYVRNQAAMDAGCRIAWPERFAPKYTSAIHHAMVLKLRDEVVFWAEYQNAPLIDRPEDDILPAEKIAAKINGRDPQTVPAAAGKLVMFVDVGKKLLHYVTCAFEPNYTGYVIDYGTWPDHKLQYFSVRQARRTLAMQLKGQSEEAAVYNGLKHLCHERLAVTYPRDDGAQLRVGQCLIDTGWNKDTVELFVRRSLDDRKSPFAGVLQAYKGVGVKAGGRPMDEGGKPSDTRGDNWRLTAAQGRHHVPLLLADTNHWKTFAHARLAVDIGGRGCLSLWGSSDTRHRLFSEHLVAEHPEKTSGRGRELIEWTELPGRDNHWFDCLTGCMVGASVAGCGLLARVLPVRKRKIVKAKKAVYFGNRK